jgi:hypothetical protein
VPEDAGRGGLGQGLLFFGGEGGGVCIEKEVLPPLPVNLLLIFMRLERSLVFLFSGE